MVAVKRGPPRSSALTEPCVMTLERGEEFILHPVSRCDGCLAVVSHRWWRPGRNFEPVSPRPGVWWRPGVWYGSRGWQGDDIGPSQPGRVKRQPTAKGLSFPAVWLLNRPARTDWNKYLPIEVHVTDAHNNVSFSNYSMRLTYWILYESHIHYQYLKHI